MAAAAQPIKQRIPTAPHEQLAAVRLPVDVATSTSPQGVPLHEIAKAVREEVPNVTGVAVTPAGLSLKFAKPPTAAQQRKIAALLGDKTRLEKLRPAVAAVAAPAPGAPAPADDQLLQTLRDPKTTDAAAARVPHVGGRESARGAGDVT